MPSFTSGTLARLLICRTHHSAMVAGMVAEQPFYSSKNMCGQRPLNLYMSAWESVNFSMGLTCTANHIEYVSTPPAELGSIAVLLRRAVPVLGASWRRGRRSSALSALCPSLLVSCSLCSLSLGLLIRLPLCILRPGERVRPVVARCHAQCMPLLRPMIAWEECEHRATPARYGDHVPRQHHAPCSGSRCSRDSAPHSTAHMALPQADAATQGRAHRPGSTTLNPTPLTLHPTPWAPFIQPRRGAASCNANNQQGIQAGQAQAAQTSQTPQP